MEQIDKLAKEVMLKMKTDSTKTALTAKELARFIDHTLLKPEATPDQITKLCNEAKEYSFASVCVNPVNVALAAKLLEGSIVKVCTVIGFPLGANTSFVKAAETRDAIANGADEVDMVINVGALKAKNYDVVEKDIAAVVEAANGTLVKVIIETCLLTDEEKTKVCEIAKKAGADFVKTSTGFSTAGANSQDVALMKETVGDACEVKAAGGIRNLELAELMIANGATRIGTSSGTRILHAKKVGM